MWDQRSSNPNATKLLKQVCQSDFEYREYGAPKIRPKSRKETLWHLIWWDRPPRSDFKTRSWKKHRKTQYKDR